MQQSPHWVDKVIEDILIWQKQKKIGQLHVDDMKTPSGRVHTGALRGALLHDIVAKALAAKTKGVVSTYVFNDMDPMDALPGYLDPAEYAQHMGKPLYRIPAPALEKSGINFAAATTEEKESYRLVNSFAEFYALDFIAAFRELGSSQ